MNNDDQQVSIGIIITVAVLVTISGIMATYVFLQRRQAVILPNFQVPIIQLIKMESMDCDSSRIEETGLWYFRTRYYSESLGRFASRDLLGYVDGIDAYVAYFVPGKLDPTGTQAYEVKRQSPSNSDPHTSSQNNVIEGLLWDVHYRLVASWIPLEDRVSAVATADWFRVGLYEGSPHPVDIRRDVQFTCNSYGKILGNSDGGSKPGDGDSVGVSITVSGGDGTSDTLTATFDTKASYDGSLSINPTIPGVTIDNPQNSSKAATSIGSSIYKCVCKQ